MWRQFLWRTMLSGGLLILAVIGGSNSARAQRSAPAETRQRADALANRADSLRSERELTPALRTYQQALDLYRQLDDSARVAVVLGDIGALEYLSGNAEAALAHFETALEHARAAGTAGPTANNLNNIGLIHYRKGRYDQALRHIREAVQVHRSRGDSASVASGLNNLANIQEEQGAYDAARENLSAALDVNRDLGNRSSVADNLNNIALILRSQGRVEAALRRHRQALEVHTEMGEKREMAADLNNIGLIHRIEQRYDDAVEYYRKAVDINRDLGREVEIASNLSNIGSVLRRQGRYEEALSHHRKALRIHREHGERARVAVDLDNLGEVYEAQQQYDVALDAYRKALSINRTLGRRHGIAINLENIGGVYLKTGAYTAADSVFTEAIDTTEQLLRTTSGADRRDFLAKEIQRFQALVTARVRAGRTEEALRVFEQSRARLLSERLTSPSRDSTPDVPPVDSLQAAVGVGEAAILYTNTDTERPILALVVTRDSVFAREIADDSTLKHMDRRFGGAIDRLRVRDEIRWAGTSRSSVLREGKGISVGSKSEGTLADFVRLYHYDVSVPPKQQVLSTERREMLGRFLYGLLVDPIEEDLAAVDELVVVPDGALSYLPFDALSDWDGTRLVQRWRVRYVQSLRVLRLLQRRDGFSAPTDRRPLLALGGVVYDSTNYAADTAAAAGTRRLEELDRSDFGLRSNSRRTEQRGGSVLRAPPDESPASTYRKLGYGPENWRNLTGTLREARALARLADGSRVLVGEQAREGAIHQMSQAGALADYRALHFATHGFVVPEEPDLSALVLSEVALGSEGLGEVSSEGEAATEDVRTDDGYLSMEEIASLDLQAEFVGLSACRTGIGRIYRGSGAVSLAHGFLRAGANSVAVSLWSVYDASTRRFMEAVYRRAWDRETSWSEAMARTKRAFANGHHGERLQAPRFWAPFVYYGWESEGSGP